MHQNNGSSTSYTTVEREPRAPIIVSPLKYGDILRATETYRLAFRKDPLHLYIRNGHELSPLEKTVERLYLSLYLALCMHTKIALTVYSGTANITAAPPKENGDGPKHDPLAKLFEWLKKALRASRKPIRNPVSKKRAQEVEKKLEEAAKRKFGDRLEKMWYVEGLWADPASQGHGYGGALLDSVTILADLAGRSTWLQSSNIANTPFYNQHGFETIETVIFGDQDPTWNGKPVVVSLMVREPRWPPASGVN